MKKILFTILIFALSQTAKAQMPTQLQAEKIASRMKDTLSLSTGQKAQLYAITSQIQGKLILGQRQYAGSDSLAVKLQQIENMRDSLYRTVLTDDQFNRYKMKKTTLVHRY